MKDSAESDATSRPAQAPGKAVAVFARVASFPALSQGDMRALLIRQLASTSDEDYPPRPTPFSPRRQPTSTSASPLPSTARPATRSPLPESTSSSQPPFAKPPAPASTPPAAAPLASTPPAAALPTPEAPPAPAPASSGTTPASPPRSRPTLRNSDSRGRPTLAGTNPPVPGAPTLQPPAAPLVPIPGLTAPVPAPKHPANPAPAKPAPVTTAPPAASPHKLHHRPKNSRQPARRFHPALWITPLLAVLTVILWFKFNPVATTQAPAPMAATPPAPPLAAPLASAPPAPAAPVDTLAALSLAPLAATWEDNTSGWSDVPLLSSPLPPPADLATPAKNQVPPAKPSPAPAPAKPVLPAPSEAFKAYVASLRITGVLQRSPARAVINGETYQVGDIIDPANAIRLVDAEFATRRLIFEDATRARLAAPY